MEENIQTTQMFVDKYVDNLASSTAIKKAALLLQHQQVVAFPTETVYGLGGNALSDEAIRKIFTAKGRPADNPLIVHITDEAQLDELVDEVPPSARVLLDAFWPGPLTVTLPVQKHVSSFVTAGLSTIGVRMPRHPVAKAVIAEAGLPIAAPSANRSGRPSPTTAAHVATDLQGKIAGIVDGGPTGIGLESTVLHCEHQQVTILRPGGITRQAIQEVVDLPVIDGFTSLDVQTPQAPGMKYRHYAPQAVLYLVEGSLSHIQQHITARQETGEKVGMLATEESKDRYDADVVLSTGSRSDLLTISRQLYSTLRRFDDTNVTEIYSEVFPEDGIGAAIMNRLRKSAGGRRLQLSDR